MVDIYPIKMLKILKIKKQYMLNKKNCPVGTILVTKYGSETKVLATSSLAFLMSYFDDFTLVSNWRTWEGVIREGWKIKPVKTISGAEKLLSLAKWSEKNKVEGPRDLSENLDEYIWGNQIKKLDEVDEWSHVKKLIHNYKIIHNKINELIRAVNQLIEKERKV